VSVKRPRARSPQSLELQKIVARWKRRWKLNGLEEQFTDGIGKCISARLVMRRVPSKMQKDLRQQSWLIVLRRLPGYDVKRGAVSTFVFQAVDHAVNDWIAKDRTQNLMRQILVDQNCEDERIARDNLL
jgi:hypothetical protein